MFSFFNFGDNKSDISCELSASVLVHSQGPVTLRSSVVNGAFSCYLSLSEDLNLLGFSGCFYMIIGFAQA